jgi:hypothetical protein
VERANRLVQNKARANTIGFDDMIDAVMKKTWYSPTPAALEGVVHRQTQQQVLNWLTGVYQSDDANFEVKAICRGRLMELNKKIDEWIKTEKDNNLINYYSYTRRRIESPDKVNMPKPVVIPPGAPIGCDVD